MSLKGVMQISKNHLIFIANELLSPQLRRELRLPLEFISYGFIDGKMYKHYNNDGTFTLQHGNAWGNSVVYGAIFVLTDYDFYIRTLDSYHQCSNALLGRNHTKDIHHRVDVVATPIAFDTLDDLSRLKYRESDELDVQTYLGNINHPKINQRLNKTNSYRIIDGIDKHFKTLFREEFE